MRGGVLVGQFNMRVESSLVNLRLVFSKPKLNTYQGYKVR